MDSEQKIADTLGELKGEMTIIAIAHRLSTLRSVDRLVLIEEGRFTAEGTFAQLYRDNATFKRYLDQSNIEVEGSTHETG